MRGAEANRRGTRIMPYPNRGRRPTHKLQTESWPRSDFSHAKQSITVRNQQKHSAFTETSRVFFFPPIKSLMLRIRITFQFAWFLAWNMERHDLRSKICELFVEMKDRDALIAEVSGEEGRRRRADGFRGKGNGERGSWRAKIVERESNGNGEAKHWWGINWEHVVSALS